MLMIEHVERILTVYSPNSTSWLSRRSTALMSLFALASSSATKIRAIAASFFRRYARTILGTER